MPQQKQELQRFNVKEVRTTLSFDEGAEYPIVDYHGIAAEYYQYGSERRTLTEDKVEEA